eukprot:TRINITY_DN11452_c0_g1_i1.p1 TRINITY_DN11452_c0_g1~~TRINITY_DN11452_c0_g1_i1.p1  ORF type:complete len:212 (+),score=32.72 TRINITY_DN11452_c0_g1_i1:69-704(+)
MEMSVAGAESSEPLEENVVAEAPKEKEVVPERDVGKTVLQIKNVSEATEEELREFLGHPPGLVGCMPLDGCWFVELADPIECRGVMERMKGRLLVNARPYVKMLPTKRMPRARKPPAPPQENCGIWNRVSGSNGAAPTRARRDRTPPPAAAPPPTAQEAEAWERMVATRGKWRNANAASFMPVVRAVDPDGTRGFAGGRGRPLKSPEAVGP